MKIRDSIYGDTPSRPAVMSPVNVGDLSLTDHTGKPFRFSEFNKDYLLVFFGYTHCPDFCPTGLSDLALVRKNIGDDFKKIQVIFVSFDPKRDTREKMAEYMKNFDKSFIGLIGTDEEIKHVSSRFGVQYRVSKETMGDEKNYQYEHSLQYFLINSQGEISNTFRYSDGPEKISEQLREIIGKDIRFSSDSKNIM